MKTSSTMSARSGFDDTPAHAVPSKIMFRWPARIL